MKKIYLTLAAIGMIGISKAQFWTATTYKGAFPVTDGTTGTTSNDWTAGWTNWDPQNTAYGSPTVTVSSDITTNTTWTTGTIVSLQNKVYVKSGATLTIQPGVIIRGDQATQGTLIVTKGSKIMAQGTQTNPIVFTSGEAAGLRAEGDWGGLVILGQATINPSAGVANIEGIAASADTEYGGTNDADNSGVLSYVRIEFPGIPFITDKEINGLTLGGVGSGTQIDHIQISYSGDDAFEWFGGTVDAKYLIAFYTLDDDFDTDFGYRGRVQFGLAVRGDLFDAAGDSNGFESDNDATGSNAQPQTSPIFSNFTIVGPLRDGSATLPGGETFEKAFRIRRNSATSVHNSLVTGWQKGVSIEGSAAQDNITGDTSNFMNNSLINFASGTAKVTASASFYASFFTADGNDTTTTISNVNWVNAFPTSINSTPDFRLNASSTVATGAGFNTSIFTGGFLSANEIEEKSIDLTVYPNPTNGMVNVAIASTENTNAVINVIDLTGKTVLSFNRTINAGSNKVEIDLSSLNNGIYFIATTANNSTTTSKVIKK